MNNATSPPDDPLATGGPLLDRHAAAALLGISPSTIYRMVRSGELRAYRVSNAIRFSQSDLSSYIRATPAPIHEEEAT